MGALLASLLAAAAGVASAAAPWQPDMAAAKRYAGDRPGHVSFAVRVGRRYYAHRGWRSVPAASLMKPLLLAGYLRRPDVRRRRLRPDERARLGPMIRSSDNDAANWVRSHVGLEAQIVLARRIGMQDFVPYSAWGSSRTSARDQARLFQRVPRVFPRRHRRYAMGLLRTIVPGQRWGVARARPRGWRLYFKGGWGTESGPRRVNHQAALLVRGRRRVALAITVEGGSSHEAGAATLRGVARRLLRGLR